MLVKMETGASGGGGGLYTEHLANIVDGEEIDVGFTPKMIVVLFHTWHKIAFYKESMGNYSNIYENWAVNQSAFPNLTDVGIRNINGTKITLNASPSTTDVDVICLAEEPA